MRHATEADIQQLLAWGRQWHAFGPVSDQPFAAERVEAMLRHLIANGVILISEKGAAGAVSGPMWICDGDGAQEVFWWGDAKLREGLEQWAKARGCVQFTMVALENDRLPALDRLYRRAGYRPLEHHYMKAL